MDCHVKDTAVIAAVPCQKLWLWLLQKRVHISKLYSLGACKLLLFAAL